MKLYRYSALISLVIFSAIAICSTCRAGDTSNIITFMPAILSGINKPEPAPPTPTEPGVHVSPNYSHYTDSIDYLHIVGEITNNTTKYLRFVKVAVNVFNNANVLLATDYTYVYLGSVSPNEKTCFDISLTQPSDWTYYKFEAVHGWNDADARPSLSASNHSGSMVESYGGYDYEIVGLVNNSYDQKVEYVSVIGTLYNAQGYVVDCDFTYVNSTHLAPGESSGFELSSRSRDNYNSVNNYKLQVDSRWE